MGGTKLANPESYYKQKLAELEELKKHTVSFIDEEYEDKDAFGSELKKSIAIREKEYKKAIEDYQKLSAENNPDEAPTEPSANPTYGSPANLKVNEESINSFISRINSSIEEINSTWNNVVTTDIEIIKNSWASTDAANYIDKLLAEGDKISDAVQGLQLLANTYQKVLQEHAATEQDIAGSINNI